MFFREKPVIRQTAKSVAALALLTALVAGCGPSPIPSGINDPHEDGNRRRHSFNIGVDKVLYRPASEVYGTIVPPPIRDGVANVSSNLGLPSEAINGALQGRPQTFAQNGLRFVVNSTIGVLGLLDPATSMGLPRIETDFGETLHVWGMREGSYVELPFLGPSTNRDVAGMVVDVVSNPLGLFAESPVPEIATVSRVGRLLGTRYAYSDFVDSILYDSADSYAQARLLYLQSRRAKLRGDQSSEADAYDPYDDLYGTSSQTSGTDDIYSDTYDPYAALGR